MNTVCNTRKHSSRMRSAPHIRGSLLGEISLAETPLDTWAETPQTGPPDREPWTETLGQRSP